MFATTPNVKRDLQKETYRSQKDLYQTKERTLKIRKLGTHQHIKHIKHIKHTPLCRGGKSANKPPCSHTSVWVRAVNIESSKQIATKKITHNRVWKKWEHAVVSPRICSRSCYPKRIIVETHIVKENTSSKKIHRLVQEKIGTHRLVATHLFEFALWKSLHVNCQWLTCGFSFQGLGFRL